MGLPGGCTPRAKGWGYQGGAPLGPRGGATRGVQLLGCDLARELLRAGYTYYVAMTHRELLWVEDRAPCCDGVCLGHILQGDAEERDEVGVSEPVNQTMCKPRVAGCGGMPRDEGRKVIGERAVDGGGGIVSMTNSNCGT